MTSSQATRPVRVSHKTCWRNSRWPSRPSPPWVWWSGRWSSSRADDALASAVQRFGSAGGVDQVVICSPDKDLTQLVSGSQVVGWDRCRDIVYDETAVLAKYGVRPTSIPDWLALVGDSADGFPGVPRWGAKSASAVLGVYTHLEAIPDDPRAWSVKVRGADALAASLREHRDDALLFRRLATLRDDVPLVERLDDLRWRGVKLTPLRGLTAAIIDEPLRRRAEVLAAARV
jgi:5'-3' exonuclease